MEFEIIDFHTHPFISDGTNICQHKGQLDMSPENTKTLLSDLGIKKICGSVIGLSEGISKEDDPWKKVEGCNNEALKLKDMYGDFYVPGFNIQPDYVEKSCMEIERMKRLGVNLIGEIVPVFFDWKGYARKDFWEIMKLAEENEMVVNICSGDEDETDKLVKEFKSLKIVAAHPGEYYSFNRHMERMKISKNYHLDLSGYGLFRHGMLRHGINKFGAERFLFGSDYPTCNAAMYIGGVYFDNLISDKDKELIFSGNAKRLLNLN